MKRKDAVQWIKDSNTIFSVKFTKRTTGETREMVCRRKVTVALKGGEKKFSDEEKNLLTVYDMTKHEYRSIPIEGITELKIEGKWRKVT